MPFNDTKEWVMMMVMKYLLQLIAVCLLAGCTSTTVVVQHLDDVQVELEHNLVIEDHQENPMTTPQFWKMVDDADVIILGELHDHVVGHAFQREIVDRVMSNFPTSTLALEMLERDEQPIIDDFMDGIIDEKRFATLTHSEHWSGKDTWQAWYQPIIDCVKSHNGSVVGANAPRRYVSLARTNGFEAIDALSESRRSYVTIPSPMVDNHYQERFFEFAGIEDEEIDDNHRVYGFYRSQQVWDATMAKSVAQLKPTAYAKVILLVGQFHVEYEGGLIQFLKKDLPDSNILVITVHRTKPEIEFEDIPLSDVIVYER